MLPRPVLTARWTELLLLNFPVPLDAIAPIAPPGTEPDLHEGQTYISVVGFRFHAVRLFGLAIPGHTSFPEINLRYYVRRHVGNETRRGVVFVREIAPRRAVAIIANQLYNENYITRPMRTTITMKGPALAPDDTIEYAWRSRRSQLTPSPTDWLLQQPVDPVEHAPRRLRLRHPLLLPKKRWNRLAARVTAPLALPATGSLEEFIVEHYWGYVHARDETTREYRVSHDPWQVAAADNVVWDCDVPANYNTPLAEYLQQPPTSAIIAAGSPIQLFRGNRI